MKKLVLIAMVIGMMMMAGPASAAHSETKRYDTPALGQGDLLSLCGGAPLNSCVTFAILPGEQFVSIDVNDDSGQDTYFTVGQDINDDGLTDISKNYCGSTGNDPFPVLDTVALGVPEVIVFPHSLPGLGNDAFAGAPAPCAGVGTQGSVTANFTP